MTWLLLLKRFWPYIAGAALLAGLALWAQRAIVGYGNERARAAVAPWQAAQTAAKERRAADDRTNREQKATIEARHAKALADIARDRDGLRGMLADARVRTRRLEEAHRLALADAAGRVAAGSDEVARLLERVGAARERADADLSAYDQAAQRDALKLTDLQDQVRPWARVE